MVSLVPADLHRARPATGRRRHIACALLLSLTTALAGCEDTPPLPKTHAAAEYRLGPGDQIRIVTYGDERLSGTFRVADNGNIAMPLLGSVPAQGLSADGLAHAIAAELQSRQLLKNASVSVQVESYRPVFILGEVSRPGQYPYEPGMTALTVVAIAGGFTYRARKQEMLIERTAEGGTVQGLAPSTTQIEPGDVITVQERYF